MKNAISRTQGLYWISRNTQKTPATRSKPSPKKPLVLLESVKLEDGHFLKIEQRGCEDVYFKFTKEVTKNANTPTAQVESLATQLTKLKLSKKALINEKGMQELADKVKARAKKSKKIDGEIICLEEVSSECITDVKVTVTHTKVELTYIARP